MTKQRTEEFIDGWQATDASEPEPLVSARDVAAVVNRSLFTASEDEGITEIADASGISPRTIRRVLDPEATTCNLKIADHLLVACGGHISECELIWPNGVVDCSDG